MFPKLIPFEMYFIPVSCYKKGFINIILGNPSSKLINTVIRVPLPSVIDCQVFLRDFSFSY